MIQVPDVCEGGRVPVERGIESGEGGFPDEE